MPSLVGGPCLGRDQQGTALPAARLGERQKQEPPASGPAKLGKGLIRTYSDPGSFQEYARHFFSQGRTICIAADMKKGASPIVMLLLGPLALALGNRSKLVVTYIREGS